MSRRVDRSISAPLPVAVTCDAAGVPVAVTLGETREPLPVLQILDHWREWIGAAFSEPERDVWRLEIGRGICELHCVHHWQRTVDPAGEEPGAGSGASLEPGTWTLYRWED
jgi:hypothetical protein